PGPSDGAAHLSLGRRVGRIGWVTLRAEAETAYERRPQPARRHAPELHLVAAHEGRERAQRARDAGDRLVLIQTIGPPRRCAGRREPGLEVNMTYLKLPVGAVGLGGDAADELPVVE